MNTGQDAAPAALRPFVVCIDEVVVGLVGFGHHLGHCRLGWRISAWSIQWHEFAVITLDNLLGKTKPQGSLTGSANGDGILAVVLYCSCCDSCSCRRGSTRVTVIGRSDTTRLQVLMSLNNVLTGVKLLGRK